MQKGKLVGRGMTAEVYSWGQDKVLKLYFDWVSEESIKYEAEVGRAVFEAGIPSPAVYDIVEEDSRKGIIYQCIEGESMLRKIESKPWKISKYARDMARLHFKIHSCKADELPSQMESFKKAINQSTNLLGDRTKKILDYMDSLTEGSSVCHGDFHPDNILVTNSKMTAIDWNNSYSGNPLCDVARTCLIILTPFMPPDSSKLLVMLSKHIKNIL